MKLNWLNNGFISRELYAPFTVEKDADYLEDLSKRLKIVLQQAKNAGADAESIDIIEKYGKKIKGALRFYYCADISRCNAIILNLIRDIGDALLAVSELSSSRAFRGAANQELQLFRCRTAVMPTGFAAKDMLHLPQSCRAKAGNYRFSIPGNPSYYLANTSYGCWIETGCPVDSEFNVSPVLLDGSQKIFNLAVEIRDFSRLDDLESTSVHTWLKLLMLKIATSYTVTERNRNFKSEYIISQSVMMVCKKLGYDGVSYYSNRVDDEAFAKCAINLALFVEYDKEYSKLIRHMKIDDPFNYAVYKNLGQSLKYKQYELRIEGTGFITNIGNYDIQFPYCETEFFKFDQFLFANWLDKPNGKGKDQTLWGVEIG